MKKLYLVGMGIVLLFILILALPQIGTVGMWYPPVSANANPALVLFQAAGLGAIFGGLSVLFWKSKGPHTDEEGESGSEDSKS